MIRKHIDTLATTIIITMVLWGIRILLIIVYAGIVGIDTAGFAALITSAGVAIGLALQGSLSNLAGGIILAVTKPFKLDDYIESSGVSGTVEDMKLFYTELITPDNKVVMVPNGKLANDTIINYSTKDIRRVDLTFSISYEDNVKKAIETISSVVEKHSLILKNPAYAIKEAEHASSSVNISTKVWVKNEDYWTVHFDLLEQVHQAFNENDITIPYTQIEIRTK
jgi:small conductance mechanosensitive channel